MIEKITVGAGLWIALQFSTFEFASEQGKAMLAQSVRVQQQTQDTRCAQAWAFGLNDLRVRG